MADNLWEELFSQMYKNDVDDLINGDLPRILRVSYTRLETYLIARTTIEHAETMLGAPSKTLSEMDGALTEYITQREKDESLRGLPPPRIRLIDLPGSFSVRRRDLRAEHASKLVVMEGIVVRATQPTERIIIAQFKCQRCDHVTLIPQTDRRFTKPFECENDGCGRKGPFHYMKDESERIDYQVVRLQELPETLKGGEKSQVIDVVLEEDLAGILNPGNKVSITGIVTGEQEIKNGEETPFIKTYLHANNVQIIDSRDNIIVTPEDRTRMYALASDPDIVDKLVASFAPSLYGLAAIKEGMLCSAVSHGFLIRDDGTVQRGFSHMLVCTDPAMGKSEQKWALKKIMPDIVLSSGTGASAVGLTAGVVKDDFANGAFSVEFGALPLADGAGLIIDESDKLPETDRKKLNDSLSDCRFKIDKGGFHMELWTRCFVIAFLNPKSGRFDPYESNILKDINIPPDTLSRFDLIFTVPDIPNEIQDSLEGERMVSSWIGEKPDVSGAIPTEDLQKYIAIARKIDSVFSPEIADAVLLQYKNARRNSKDGRIAVTKRYMEALFRLSRAEAQLMLSSNVTLVHFNRAVALLDVSLMHIGRDENGNLDADLKETGAFKSQRDRVRVLIEIIKELQDEMQSAAPLHDIMERAVEAGMKEDGIEYIINRLKTVGELIEASNNRYRVVG